MSFDTSVRMIPRRRSIVGTPPQRETIKVACSTETSLRKVTIRFNVGIMALHRHLNGPASEYRMAFSAAVSNLGNTRWHEVTTSFAAFALTYPDARADLDVSVQRNSMPVIATDIGGHVHAA